MDENKGSELLKLSYVTLSLLLTQLPFYLLDPNLQSLVARVGSKLDDYLKATKEIIDLQSTVAWAADYFLTEYRKENLESDLDTSI